MKLLSIGDEVREGTYRLHSSFRRAVNFTNGRRLVTLVTQDIGAGPLNIVVRRLPDIPGPFLRVTPQLLASVRSGGPASSAFARLRRDKPKTAKLRSACPPKPLGEGGRTRPTMARNLAVLERLLVEESHPRSLAFLLDERRAGNFRSGFEVAFVERIRAGVTQVLAVVGRSLRERRSWRGALATSRGGLGEPALPKAIRLLAGCGFGLTPSGDDFIAGMLIALNVLGQPRRAIEMVCDAALGDNDLSNAFLRLARDGRMTEKQQDLVSALLCHGVTEVRGSARKVLEVGETSGADWATGFVMTVRRFSE